MHTPTALEFFLSILKLKRKKKYQVENRTLNHRLRIVEWKQLNSQFNLHNCLVSFHAFNTSLSLSYHCSLLFSCYQSHTFTHLAWRQCDRMLWKLELQVCALVIDHWPRNSKWLNHSLNKWNWWFWRVFLLFFSMRFFSFFLSPESKQSKKKWKTSSTIYFVQWTNFIIIRVIILVYFVAINCNFPCSFSCERFFFFSLYFVYIVSIVVYALIRSDAVEVLRKTWELDAHKFFPSRWCTLYCDGEPPAKAKKNRNQSNSNWIIINFNLIKSEKTH